MKETKNQLNNPDCDPATKGYVKKVARKILDKSGHTHNIRTETVGGLGIRGSLIFWSFISLVLSLIAIFFSYVTKNRDTAMMCTPVVIMSGIILVASVFCQDYTVTKERVRDCYPKSVCKHEPKKEECPEDELKLPSKL
jgi:hypothetical protein